jgi:hypothetical protein
MIPAEEVRGHAYEATGVGAPGSTLAW